MRMSRRPVRQVKQRQIARRNPDLLTLPVTSIPSGPSVLFLPVTVKMVQWAAAAYRALDESRAANKVIQEFFTRRHYSVTGEILDPAVLDQFSDLQLAELITFCEGPEWASYQGSIKLGDLSELAPNENLPEVLVPLASLLIAAKEKIGLRNEYEALLDAQGNLPDYGILGRTLLNLNWISDLNLISLANSVVMLDDKVNRVLSNPDDASIIETTQLIGTMPTGTQVYYVVSGTEEDSEGFNLAPLASKFMSSRRSNAMQRSSMRGISLALLENNMFDPDKGAPRPNAGIYFAFPQNMQSGSGDATGVTEVLQYLATYRQVFKLIPTAPVRPNPRGKTNPQWTTARIRELIPADPKAPIEVSFRFGMSNPFMIFENVAPRPFSAVTPEKRYELAKQFAKEKLSRPKSGQALRQVFRDEWSSLTAALNKGEIYDAEFEAKLDPYRKPYASVEHAFQTLKSGQFDSDTYARMTEFVNNTTGVDENEPFNTSVLVGSESKNQTRLPLITILYTLMQDSFLQNQSALDLLLATYPRPFQVDPVGGDPNDNSRQAVVARLLTEIRENLKKNKVFAPSLVDVNMYESDDLAPADQPTSLELELLEPLSYSYGGLNALLRLVQPGVDGQTKERRSIQMQGSWYSDRFEIDSPAVKGQVTLIDSTRLQADLTISGIGALRGVFEAAKVGSLQAPSQQFIEDLLDVTDIKDMYSGLRYLPEMQAKIARIERLLPYKDRLSALKKAWEKFKLTRSDLVSDIERSASPVVDADFVDLSVLQTARKNPLVRKVKAGELKKAFRQPSVNTSLGFWTMRGLFSGITMRDMTEVVIAEVPNPDGTEAKVTAPVFYSELTPELKEKLPLCPYLLTSGQTAPFLYKGEIITRQYQGQHPRLRDASDQFKRKQVVRWTQQSRELTGIKLYTAFLYATRADLILTNDLARRTYETNLLQSFAQALVKMPLGVLSNGVSDRTFSFQDYYGESALVRRAAMLRRERRAAFVPVQAAVFASEAELAFEQKIGDLGFDSERIRKARLQNTRKDRLVAGTPWSFLRMMFDGQWDDTYNIFVHRFGEGDPNRTQIIRLEEELTPVYLRTLPYSEAAKELRRLAIMQPIKTEPRKKKYSRPDEPDAVLLKNVGKIRFTLFTPIESWMGVSSLATQKSKEMFEKTRQELEQDPIMTGPLRDFAIEVPWLRASPASVSQVKVKETDDEKAQREREELAAATWFNASDLDSLTPVQLQQRIFNRYRGIPEDYTPLTGIVPNGVFRPEGRYAAHSSFEFTGAELLAAIRDIEDNQSITFGYKDVNLNAAEVQRILEGRQTLIARDEKLADTNRYVIYRDRRTGERFLLRPRGASSVYEALNQEKLALGQQNDITAQLALAEALGAGPQELVILAQSDVGAEHNRFLARWIMSRQRAALFDIMPVSPQGDISLDILNGFKSIPSLPRWVFSPVMALRRFLAERFGIIPPEFTQLGVAPTEDVIVSTIWGHVRSLQIQAEQRAVLAGEKPELARAKFALKGPLIFAWSTEKAIGQLNIPTIPNENLPDIDRLRSVFAYTPYNEEAELRSVEVLPMASSYINNLRSFVVVNRSCGTRETLWKHAERLREIIDPAHPLYAYSKLYYLSDEDKKDPEKLEQIEARLNRFRDTPDYRYRLSRLMNLTPASGLTSEALQQLRLVQDFIALASMVEERCYWSAIKQAVGNDRYKDYQRGGDFLKRLVSWQLFGAEKDTRKMETDYWRESGVQSSFAEDFLSNLNALRFISIQPDDGEVVELIKSGAPFRLSGDQALVRRIGQGPVTTLLDGVIYRANAEPYEGGYLLSFKQVPIEEIPTSSLLRAVMNRKLSIFDPEDPKEIYSLAALLMLDMPTKPVHEGSALQVTNFLNQFLKISPQNEFAQTYLTQIAKANPRDARRPRRARRNGGKMNPFTRYNPYTPEEAEIIAEFTGSLAKDKSPDPETLIRAQQLFSDTTKTVPQATRSISSVKLGSYFPTDYKNEKGEQIMEPTRPGKPGDWATPTRIKQGAVQQELITRPFRERRKGDKRVDNPFEDWSKTRPLISSDIEVTAEDAAVILEEQRKKQIARRKATVPASAGLCKATRSKRLMDYSPPPEIMKAVKNDILLWMSPDKIDGQAPKVIRVLQFRKGDHIDCDLSAAALEEDLTGLLSRALQASLFWLTEKPKRDRKVNIWVGRAGTSTIYCAYRKPSESDLGDLPKNQSLPLTLDMLTDTLTEALQNKPGLTKTFSVDIELDKRNWQDATNDIREKRRATVQSEVEYVHTDGRKFTETIWMTMPEGVLEQLARAYADADVTRYVGRNKGPENADKRRSYFIKILKEKMSPSSNARPNGRRATRNPFHRSRY
jgi:hypothetical protein